MIVGEPCPTGVKTSGWPTMKRNSDGRIPTTIVVGILPSEFRFIVGHPEVFTPVGQGSPTIINNRTAHSFAVIARLKSGVTTPQAQTEMTAVQNNLDALYPSSD